MPKNLSAKVSADASDFISTMTAAAERTDELKDEASSAARQVDDLGDEASEAAAGVSRLSAANTAAASTSSALAVATGASLVPALGALSTVAIPLTATLGALATAAAGVATGFGLVVGTGLRSYGQDVAETTEGVNGAMEGLQHALEPAVEEIEAFASAIGEEFAPLMGDAIEALPEFIERVTDAIGPLGPFADALRDAGRVAFRVIPRIVSQMMDMGRNALPAVRNLGSAIANNAVPAMNAMDDTAGRVLRILPQLDGDTAAAAASLNEFGITILETVVPPLETVGSVAVDAASAFNQLDDRTQKLVASATLAAPAIAGIASKLALVSPALGVATAAVGAFALAWTQDIGGVRSTTNAFVEDATGFETVGALLEDTASQIARGAETAVDALVSWADETASVQTGLNDLESALEGTSEMVVSLANGDWANGFASFETAMVDFNDATERALVGSGGSGGVNGILDTAITDAARFLKNEGPTIIREGIDAFLAVAVDRLSTLSTVLVGPDGQSGLLSTMVDEAVFFLKNTAPPLIGAATEAIGEAIRGVLLDITAPLIKGRDSEFWDTFADVSKWLIENAPKLMAGVGNAIVQAIIAGVTGLYDGLVGNSALRTPIANAADWIIDNAGMLMSGVGGAIVDAILNGVTGLGSAIQNKVDSALDSVDAGDDGGGDDGGGGEPNPPDDSEEGGPYGPPTSGGDDDSDYSTPPPSGDGGCPDGYFFHPIKRTCEPKPGGGGSLSGPARPRGFEDGGFVEETGLAMLHGPEMVLSQDETRQAQQGGVAVGDVAVADDVKSGVSGVERKLDAIHQALREMDVDVTVQDDSGRYSTL